MSAAIIEIEHLHTVMAGEVLHENLSLTVLPGKISVILGGSGCGKTTLLREIISLQAPTAGSIKVLGYELGRCSYRELQQLRRLWGVMFQQGALFSSYTLLENIAFPLHEFTSLPAKVINEIARVKMTLCGLEAAAAHRYPAELSGGMRKRAAVARAIALEPRLLLLDEPTAGLDPNGAHELDKLIVELQRQLGLSVVMVTHDLDSIFDIADEIIFIGEKKILAQGNLVELMDPHQAAEIREYFAGHRGRRFVREFSSL